MWKTLRSLFIKEEDYSKYPSAEPKGFVTTFPKIEMTPEEKNENFRRLFQSLRK